MSDHGFKAKSKGAFMCECGAGLCDERVTMSGADYDACLDPVLAAGHGPSEGALGKCAVCGRPRGGKRRKRR